MIDNVFPLLHHSYNTWSAWHGRSGLLNLELRCTSLLPAHLPWLLAWLLSDRKQKIGKKLDFSKQLSKLRAGEYHPVPARTRKQKTSEQFLGRSFRVSKHKDGTAEERGRWVS